MATDTRTPTPRRASDPVIDEPTTATPLWARASGTLSLSLRPAPRLRQMVGVCVWAALLGCVGLAIGLRALFGVLADTPPAWYEPTIIAAGLVGIGLTVAAFVTIQRRALPYVLLAFSTAVLATSLILTIKAF